MDFVPEISHLWLRDQGIAADDGTMECDGDAATDAQIEALEELHDRVQAARCIY